MNKEVPFGEIRELAHAPLDSQTPARIERFLEIIDDIPEDQLREQVILYLENKWPGSVLLWRELALGTRSEASSYVVLRFIGEHGVLRWVCDIVSISQSPVRFSEPFFFEGAQVRELLEMRAALDEGWRIPAESELSLTQFWVDHLLERESLERIVEFFKRPSFLEPLEHTLSHRLLEDPQLGTKAPTSPSDVVRTLVQVIKMLFKIEQLENEDAFFFDSTDVASSDLSKDYSLWLDSFQATWLCADFLCCFYRWTIHICDRLGA